MKKIIVLILICFLFIQQEEQIFAHSEDSSYTIVQTNSNTDYQTKEKLSKQLQKYLNHSEWVDYNTTPGPTDFFIQHNNITYSIHLNEGAIIDSVHKKAIVNISLPILRLLQDNYKTLKKHHYGEKKPWSTVNGIIPKYEKFSILDIDTGLRFNVQRRAGASHADVQPLTKEDTAIMKEIYNGKWSWDRRAIIVEKDSERLAASMHGMPHGRGAIQNNFPGHFCIHFFESTTHASKKEDFAHSIMIKKAAGVWLENIQNMSPNEIVEAFIISVNQHDGFVLSSLLDSEDRKLLQNSTKDIEAIQHLKRLSPLPEKLHSDELQLEIPIKVHIHKNETVVKTLRFPFYRETHLDRWKLNFEDILSQL
ncbi:MULTISPECIES: hypothetical protein [Sutcliffiella]|uniref:Uncharacterized protein n=1 Tax=Sutcliffiella cohnii TaxID=33932 RepID=A0A223KQI0_9BACI|nr:MULTISPECIES: hypothetical protein [Sutcliffiella]AST91775.1 hypothetical protein BC6307_11035 [Sutcliffiella cohnii]WBL12994.1 hypothetical protein O1A01_13705 [Sutcliffiella sp. NC1]